MHMKVHHAHDWSGDRLEKSVLSLMGLMRTDPPFFWGVKVRDKKQSEKLKKDLFSFFLKKRGLGLFWKTRIRKTVKQKINGYWSQTETNFLDFSWFFSHDRETGSAVFSWGGMNDVGFLVQKKLTTDLILILFSLHFWFGVPKTLDAQLMTCRVNRWWFLSDFTHFCWPPNHSFRSYN